MYDTGSKVKHRIPECDLNTACPLHEAGSTVPGAGFQGLRRQRSVVIPLSEREKAPSKRALNRQLGVLESIDLGHQDQDVNQDQGQPGDHRPTSAYCASSSTNAWRRSAHLGSGQQSSWNLTRSVWRRPGVSERRSVVMGSSWASEARGSRCRSQSLPGRGR